MLTYTVSATDDDGTPLADTETVTITITGTNDAPVITDGPDAVSLSVTGSGITDSGTLTVSDTDLTDEVLAAVDSVAVTGTGASSVPPGLDNATLQNYLNVSPTADPRRDTVHQYADMELQQRLRELCVLGRWRNAGLDLYRQRHR